MYREGDSPIAGFRLVESLGRGAIGEVWRAAGPGGVPSAMKVIRLDGTRALSEYLPIGRAMLVRHPGIMPWVRLSVKDQNGMQVEEPFIDGEIADDAGAVRPSEIIIVTALGEKSLSGRLKECKKQGRGEIPPIELTRHIEAVAVAVDFLNQESPGQPFPAPHCSVKPTNMIITPNGLQLTDYGLSRILGDMKTTNPLMSSVYAAPEIITDNQPSDSTDQYSLAIGYTELKTGSLPFANLSVASILVAHMQGKLDLSKLPKPEQPVIRKATSLRPEDRFASAQEMVEALRGGSKPGGKKAPVKKKELPARAAVKIEKEKNAESAPPKGSPPIVEKVIVAKEKVEPESSPVEVTEVAEGGPQTLTPPATEKPVDTTESPAKTAVKGDEEKRPESTQPNVSPSAVEEVIEPEVKATPEPPPPEEKPVPVQEIQEVSEEVPSQPMGEPTVDWNVAAIELEVAAAQKDTSPAEEAPTDPPKLPTVDDSVKQPIQRDALKPVEPVREPTRARAEGYPTEYEPEPPPVDEDEDTIVTQMGVDTEKLFDRGQCPVQKPLREAAPEPPVRPVQKPRAPKPRPKPVVTKERKPRVEAIEKEPRPPVAIPSRRAKGRPNRGLLAFLLILGLLIVIGLAAVLAIFLQGP